MNLTSRLNEKYSGKFHKSLAVYTMKESRK